MTHTAETCTIPTHDHFGQIEAAGNGGDPITCKHCGNPIEQRDDPTGQRTDAWAESSWGDDRDFQCGLNPQDNHHEPDDELMCNGLHLPDTLAELVVCGAPMYYDYEREAYRHTEPAIALRGCSLIPPEDPATSAFRYDLMEGPRLARETGPADASSQQQDQGE